MLKGEKSNEKSDDELFILSSCLHCRVVPPSWPT